LFGVEFINNLNMLDNSDFKMRSIYRNLKEKYELQVASWYSRVSVLVYYTFVQ